MRPMLASQGAKVPTGPDWTHEVKWDGMRVLAEVKDGRLGLWSRSEKDVTTSFPELAGLAGLGHDLLVDGELVALAGGLPSFAALADRMHVSAPLRAAELARTNPVTLMVFDLLSLDGLDITALPLRDRRAALEALAISGPNWQVPPTYADGEALRRATLEQGLEGVVSKRLSAPYRPGARSADWVKLPNRSRDSFVVGGWRREAGSDVRLGALLVGEPGPTGLRYRGRVGSGLAGRQGARLRALLEPLRAEASPFADEVPTVDADGTTWVRPVLVVDVAALGLTPAGRLRQPSYVGLRPDLGAEARDG